MSAHFSRLASTTAAAMGHWLAFVVACAVVVGWAVVGIFVGYGNTLFELAINTGTTICTFLMVFLIQNSTNRSEAAIQRKLDELILSIDAADNRVAGIEQETDDADSR